VKVPGVVSRKSVAPDHPMLTVSSLGGTPNTKISYKLVGLSPQVDFFVFNKDLNATERAVKERLFYVKRDGQFVPPPAPLPEQFDIACGNFRNEFVKLVRHTAPYSVHDFVGTFVGRRRQLYEKAFDELRALRTPTDVDIAKWAKVKFFVKVEKTNFTAKPDPVPRGISPRDIKFNCLLGPYVKRIEKEVYKIIGKVYGATTVFKGLNATVSAMHMRAHWDHFSDPVAIPLDASRFDQHVSTQALEFEHSMYHAFYRGKYLLALKRYLKFQLKNKGKSYLRDGTVSFEIDGRRMSGDMNTGLGNCLLMCAMVYSFMEHIGLSVDQLRLANNGDDCVIIVERKHLGRVTANIDSFFLNLGFNMEVGDVVDVFEQIEFCQTQPVWGGDNWVMMRQMPVSIAKDCLSLKPLDNHKVLKRWCASVGQCGMSLTGGLPIAQEFYASLIRTSEGAKPLLGDPTLESGFARLAIGMYRCYRPVSEETRASFWRAFDISPDKQVAFEELYRGKSVSHPALPFGSEGYGVCF
jgi:hypothetical protein